MQLPNQYNHYITEEVENICWGKTVVVLYENFETKPTLLILDEARANIDIETEA